MKRVLLFLFIGIYSLSITAQNSFLPFSQQGTNTSGGEVAMTINDQSFSGIEIEYEFPGAVISEKMVNGQSYQYLHIEGFSHMKDVGKPALPEHIDLVAVPYGANASISIISISSVEYKDYLVHPALQPAVDSYGAPEPAFEIDQQFYNTDLLYPDMPVSIEKIMKYRGNSIAQVRICPVQYNPQKRMIRVISNIKYKIEFTSSSSFFAPQILSESFMRTFPNFVLNKQAVDKEIEKVKQIQNTTKGVNGPSKNYIIITHSDFITAADTLAQWKRQLGYTVEIISKASWSTTDVKSAIHDRYDNWNPKPDYFLIIGDQQDVPGEMISTHPTDLYYACMDGGGDYVPDMAHGRISAANSAQADMIVQKIINYEKNPVNDPSIYSRGTHCAYFQHAGGGYAERRFAQTAEEIRDYMTATINWDIERIYVTDASTTPTNWNNGSYSSGEPLPNYLLKPGFAWDGDNNDIINAIDNGTSYVLHRDHGGENLWGDPYFDKTDIENLNNQDKLPIVFSINCLTGKYSESECFAEKFLRKDNGGCVGIFAHSEVSYSGYNDGLAFGLFDAIWANPGLVPNFTGSGGVSNPNVTPHNPIYTMGNVANHSLIRMVETWGDNQYTFELFHYHGDPAMKMWTDVPVPITSVHGDSILCNSDTTFTISNSSCADGLATLVVDDELIGQVQLVNGAGTIHFAPITGSYAWLTISKHNYKPYVAKVPIYGGCIKAKFIADKYQTCLPDSITFEDLSSGTISTWLWDFGVDAVPATAATGGPHTVKWTSWGPKTVKMTLSGPSGTYIDSISVMIDQYCEYITPPSGNLTITQCPGKLYDDGGTGNYSNNTNGFVTIDPPGVSSVVLNFQSFNFEAGYDYLYIYDGPDMYSPLIGQYDGNSLPNGGTITSTWGPITLRQATDGGTTESGFELIWTCNYPNQPPVANFKFSDSTTCVGEIGFMDYSSNLPDTWYWDFGDGTSSNMQHPSHTYTTNGTYSVKLVVSNAYGSDSITMNNIIIIDRPLGPVCPDAAVCDSGSVVLTATGNGLISWWDAPSGGVMLDTGATYTTPFLTSSASYYIQDDVQGASDYGAKYDNSGGGGYFTYNGEHYLVFDCYKAVKLKSVKVYSDMNGNRTIELQDASGSLLQSATVYIPSGESRITLDFDVPAGNNLRLVGPPSPHLYRNNSGLSYPYPVGTAMSVKHSSASSDPTGYYYFFYDWEIEGEMCISARTQVNVNIEHAPLADFNFTNNDPVLHFNDMSVSADTYNWDFGDGNYSNQQNPSHTYSANGVYNIKLVVENLCGKDSVIYPVTINGNFGGCNIDGTVTYNNTLMTPLTNVTIELIDNYNSVVATAITDAYGYYSFNNISQGIYSLNATTNKTWGGGNAADALSIMQHFVNITNLTGLNRKAADVDASSFVNTTDALKVAQRFVLMVSSFPSGDWCFEDVNFTIDNTTSYLNIDFMGQCYGDVDGSYIPGTKMSNGIDMKTDGKLIIDDSENIQLPVYLNKDIEAGSMSLVFEYNNSAYNVNKVEFVPEGDNFLYNIEDGKIYISWYDIETLTLNSEKALFNILMSKSGSDFNNLNLSISGESEITDNAGVRIEDVKLSVPSLEFNQYYLGHNHPNPFTKNTEINYTIPENGKVTLKVFNLLGEEISVLVDENKDAGSYSVVFDGSGLTPGVYVYRIEASGENSSFSESKMMILND
jgi:PKD repeat protein